MSLGLDSLDLNIQESKIYVTLLALGPLSLGEVIKYAEFALDDTIKAIEGLRAKGYLHEIKGVANRYNAIIPWDDLRSSTEITISQMEILAGQLDEYIAQKLEIILGKMREESQKMSDGLSTAQTGVNQVEMKAEGDIEARIARFTLEVEQETDQIKDEINKTFETKTSEHQGLISELKDAFNQEAETMSSGFQTANQKLLEGYQSGIDEKKSNEEQRNSALITQSNELVSKTEESIIQGIQNVHSSMENTGQILFNSIDERNKRLESHITNLTGEFSDKVRKISDNSQLKAVSAIGSCNDKIQEQLTSNKQDVTSAFTTTKEEIETKSVNTAQNLQQTVNEALGRAQNQLNDMLQKAQENLTQTVTTAKNQVETSIKEFSESVKLQTENDIQKIILNTETTFGGLAQDVQGISDGSKEEITSVLSEMNVETKQKTDEVKSTALTELISIIDSLKTSIKSELDGFKSTLIPQENFLKERITSFHTEFTSSQNQAIAKFSTLMEDFKSSVASNHQDLSELISGERNNLLESINQFITEMNNQIASYDSQFNENLKASAVKSSEKIIAKTTEFQEKMTSVVNEMSTTASNQLSNTSELISSSIEAEIGTLETELADYASKFKEMTIANEEVFKNHLFSLKKLGSLVKETIHPEVQTAPIISKEATITYIRGMFSRMKGGITLLLPNINDIPLDLILASKNHQRVSVVSVIDIEKHKDLLKNLFQKPNVRVRSVDQTKFIGVEGYLAADRDGEEVLIGIKEDKGEIVAIASESDAFINLMGKIVLGDYFLARSHEINRTAVGM